MKRVIPFIAVFIILIILSVIAGLGLTGAWEKLFPPIRATDSQSTERPNATTQTTPASNVPATALSSGPEIIPTTIVTPGPTEPLLTPKLQPTFKEPPTQDYKDILANPDKYAGKKLSIWFYGVPDAGRGSVSGSDGKTQLEFYTGFDRANNTWGIMISENPESRARPYLIGGTYIFTGYLVGVDFNRFNPLIGTPPVLMVTEWQELTMPVGLRSAIDPDTYELTAGTLPDTSKLIPTSIKR